jgi:calcineurin-like phosphoesterase family protein
MHLPLMNMPINEDKHSKIWLISDTHFGDEAIVGYENRPFTRPSGQTQVNMEKALIERWNGVVGQGDEVFHLGDVGYGGPTPIKGILEQLNGRKMLVMGNHDREKSPQWWRTAGFEEVSKWPITIEDFFILQHEPPAYYTNRTPFFYIFGHVHGTPCYPTLTKTSACVCVERWDYTPVSLMNLCMLSRQAIPT